ncbi:hypothetical protein K0504_02625 [Neiella marina]|uniref:Uncharacterized protein n=1 Tax=Neiella holothuriorum TaxID=2870530 RepID=A0ABS7EC60_9GAMM|nr:hypothetical protein [Neiella holothuriorum]MBW8189918.1 hypothetical protein [Neiella holothuriorum]
MKWLADNARFTLLYKHLASRADDSPTAIPSPWETQLETELGQITQSPWRKLSGRQKMLALSANLPDFGKNGLQPRHWFKALRFMQRSPARFGHVVILAILLLGITVIHTDYLLLEVSRQFQHENQPMPLVSSWLMKHGMLVAYGIMALVLLFSLNVKLQYRSLVSGFEQLNPRSRWLGHASFLHLNIAITLFLLTKLTLKQLENYWEQNAYKRMKAVIQPHQLSFMGQDLDCAELLLHQHIENAMHASSRRQKVFAYMSYLMMAAWLCTLMFGISQAFLDWGKLGI